MNIIAAGQNIVTTEAEDACPLCGYWTCRCNDVLKCLPEFDTVAGQDALRGIVEDLERTALDGVDVEDLAYYRSLLGASVVRLADYRTATQERGLAA